MPADHRTRGRGWRLLLLLLQLLMPRRKEAHALIPRHKTPWTERKGGESESLRMEVQAIFEEEISCHAISRPAVFHP